MKLSRYTFLVFSCVMLPLVAIAGLGIAGQQAPAAEQGHVVLVSDPGTPPAWAQSPSSNQGTRNNPPPNEAASGPVLPGPPSMPLPGLALLAFAGGALAYRKLRSN